MKHALRARTRALPAAALAFALAASAGTGCAVFPRRPPAPARPAPGYERLRDELAAVDASGLAGRRIALDPGHGGTFRGALGVGGLTEAEVNLGVARHLRDLLAAHGAEVFMTRESDRDFLTPADSALRADLAERARLATGSGPDLLISIHHNADPRGARDLNETQTYYKLGDDGPSLDAAQDVHRALVHNVGIRTNKVVPGNFYMLRSSAAPALLTETSYITNPDVEERLRLPEKQDLEAQAIFIGLARYFARKVPVIEEFDDGNSPADSVPRLLPGDPVLWARVRGAFDQAQMRIDGRSVQFLRMGDRLASWSRPPLPPGEHVATLGVRLAGVGAARERWFRFLIQREAARIALESWDSPVVPPGPVAVRMRVVDGLGFTSPAPDTLRLHALSPGDLPAETTVVTRDGEAWAYFRLAPRPPGGGRPTAFTMRAVLTTPRGSMLRESLSVEPGRSGSDSARRLFLTRLPEGDPLRGVPAAGTPAAPWLNRDGFAIIPLSDDVPGRVATLPGFRPVPDSTEHAWPSRWTALCGGALHGRRIVLDPEGGGEDAAGQGPGGTRAASLNLESARILAGFLAAAGADVRLTREGDLALSEVERVQASEAFQAERFLRIAHRAAPPRLGHHAASPAGKAWAERSALTLAALGLAAPGVTGETQYVIQQTSCPALFASPASLGDEVAEARLLAPGALRAEAYALFLALAREWAPQAAWPTDSLTVLDAAGHPVPDAAVTLGGALVHVTDASGRIRFARTEPGPIDVVVEDSRVRSRGILLDFQRGAVLTGTIGR
jgi:N-acetylmuramoyl-L-alanine amidase